MINLDDTARSMAPPARPAPGGSPTSSRLAALRSWRDVLLPLLLLLALSFWAFATR